MTNQATSGATKTWFITGTSSGFGRLLTEQLLARGDRVAATLRKVAELDDLVARTDRGRLWVRALDVTDSAAVRRVVDEAFGALGRIDVVVNNAGYGLFGAAEEVSDEQIRRQIETNVIGSIQVIRAALPHLRVQGGGRILQVASEGGQITYPGFGLYHTSKWAIEGFCETLAKEVASFGIEVTIVEPGPTRTKFGAGLATATPMAAYDATPVGLMRDLSGFKITGDPAKMTRAMIESVARTPAPLRLALGSTTYGSIRDALTRRLAELEASKAITLATDVDD
jgi:NAD(P)-dependent dehydrogenase (short-subunit alcohol dehydrogenase family)